MHYHILQCVTLMLSGYFVAGHHEIPSTRILKCSDLAVERAFKKLTSCVTNQHRNGQRSMK